MSEFELKDADALREHLDALNEEGNTTVAVGLTAADQPFLITLTGPYAENEHVLLDSPWQTDIDWQRPRCDECGAVQPDTIDALAYPVKVMTP